MEHVSTEIADHGMYGPAENARNRMEASADRLGAKPQDGMALRPRLCCQGVCTLVATREFTVISLVSSSS